jgi:uncharacterized lipoprotein YmbA
VSLDTERIAVAGPDTRFDYYSGIRWAEPAPLMIQHLLVEALAADGRFATVVAVPSRVPSKYQLEIELRRFEAETDGHGPPVVKVEMQVMLLDRRGRHPGREFSCDGVGRGGRGSARRGAIGLQRGHAPGDRARSSPRRAARLAELTQSR